jgi:hypothetical protein
MAMNLVQQGEDLQNFSDEALAGELQTGQRGYLPIAVISEIERRVRDRERYQQNAMAQQAGSNPVAQQRLMELMSQGQPQGMAGMAPGMEGAAQAQPQPGMAPQAPGMGMGMPAPMAAPQAAPVGIMGAAPQGMPVQGMAEGGIVRAQAGMTAEAPAQKRIRIQRELTEARRTGASPERIRDLELQLDIAAPGRMSEGALRSMGLAPGTDPRMFQPIMRRPSIDVQQPNFDITMPQADQAPVGIETVASPTGRAAQLPSATPQFAMPPRGNFMQTYGDIRKDLELQPYQVKSQRVDPFFIEERERLKGLRPDRERFQKERESDLLVGLGSVIAGATRRGDIAQGLAGLAAQQREAQRGFKQEEREYMGIESALRREERAEEAARRDRQRAMEREEREESRYQDTAAMALADRVYRAEKDERDARLQVQQLNMQLQAAQDKAEREGMSAQLKMLMDTVTMQLRQAQTELAQAQALKATAEAEAAGRFSGSGATPARDVFSSPAR